MKFQCLDCKKQFLYAATKTITASDNPEKETIFTANAVPTRDMYETESTEYRCCPYCGSMDFDEIVKEESEIVSVKSVNLDEVDEWLSKGYTVQSLYAKNAVLTKKEYQKELDTKEK